MMCDASTYTIEMVNGVDLYSVFSTFLESPRPRCFTVKVPFTH